MTPKELFETQIAGRLNTDESLKDFDAVYQFNVSGDDGGNWTVNLRDSVVSQGTDDAADCTIGIAGGDLIDLVNGDASGPQLFMGGKIAIEGDMGLAMKLQNVLGG